MYFSFVWLSTLAVYNPEPVHRHFVNQKLQNVCMNQKRRIRYSVMRDVAERFLSTLRTLLELPLVTQ